MRHNLSIEVKKTIYRIPVLSMALAFLVLAAVPADGHGIFKKTLEKKYKNEGLKVTCNMCHVKGEKKTERNEVGQVFFAQFDGQDLSARWDAVEGDDRKKLEADVMAPAFLKALDSIYEQEKAGKLKSSFNIQIPAGEVEGSKLKKK